MASRFGKLSLPEILAQIVEYSRDDYRGPDSIYPTDVGWNCAYVCACFLAQHTKHGSDEGVDTESPWAGLKVMEDIPFKERVKLAEKLVESWNNG